MEGQECGTGWLRDDRSSRDADLQLHIIVHGVFSMDKSDREFGKARRQVEILKLRGTPYSEGSHDYSIVSVGVVVFPRMAAAVYRNVGVSDRVSIGHTVHTLL